MKEWEINFEQRMALRVSDLAISVLEDDALNFNIKSKSDQICRIFENHYENSRASIGRTLSAQSQQLLDLLDQKETPQSVIQALHNYRKQELLDLFSKTDKTGKILNLRIQNETKDKLEACSFMEGKYYNRPSLYLRAVVEDYCSLGPAQREKIYFSDRFALIEYAIEKQLQLRITVSSGRTFLVHPYKLQTDKLKNSWYLACYTRNEKDPVSKKRCASIRISSIQKIRVVQKEAFLSQQLQKELQDKIETQGIQFLVEDPMLIKVKMLKGGPEKYASISTLRPPCHKKENDIWEFYCTKRQAMRYFSRMATDCVIIEPESLQQSMYQYLQTGANLYKKK